MDNSWWSPLPSHTPTLKGRKLDDKATQTTWYDVQNLLPSAQSPSTPWFWLFGVFLFSSCSQVTLIFRHLFPQKPDFSQPGIWPLALSTASRISALFLWHSQHNVVTPVFPYSYGLSFVFWFIQTTNDWIIYQSHSDIIPWRILV